MPVGITPLETVPCPDQTREGPPLILWNHRLEYDKNPDSFFKLLIRLKNEGYLFNLAFLGESNEKALRTYQEPLHQLRDNIVAQGHLNTKAYRQWLRRAIYFLSLQFTIFLALALWKLSPMGSPHFCLDV